MTKRFLTSAYLALIVVAMAGWGWAILSGLEWLLNI